MSRFFMVAIEANTSPFVTSMRRARSALLVLANRRLIRHFALLDGEFEEPVRDDWPTVPWDDGEHSVKVAP